jgi:hypothetical protein
MPVHGFLGQRVNSQLRQCSACFGLVREGEHDAIVLRLLAGGPGAKAAGGLAEGAWRAAGQRGIEAAGVVAGLLDLEGAGADLVLEGVRAGRQKSFAMAGDGEGAVGRAAVGAVIVTGQSVSSTRRLSAVWKKTRAPTSRRGRRSARAAASSRKTTRTVSTGSPLRDFLRMTAARMMWMS